MSDRDARLMARRFVLEAELLAKDPSLGITAMVVANDMVSAEYADELVAGGTDPERALIHVGSYSRFGWAVDHLPQRVLFARLGELWSGADPDDTDPRFERVWLEAWAANGSRPIFDDRPLVRAGRDLLVYRGQEKDGKPGLSWSLDLDTAIKFAKGAGVRRPIHNGVVLTLRVPRSAVLGYLTGRGEEEIVLPLRYAAAALEDA